MKFNEKFSIVSLRGKLYNKYSSKDGNHRYYAYVNRIYIGYINYLQPLQWQCYSYIDKSTFKETFFKKYGMHGSVICIMWKFGNRYYFKNTRQLPTNKLRKLARQQNKSICCLYYSKQYYSFVLHESFVPVIFYWLWLNSKIEM